jgi:hypothetical protein
MASSLTVYAAFLVLAYLVGLCCYRLLLDPLAGFPGPKLAALTLWYEFYYDVVRRGQYTFKIRDMHGRYGMSYHTYFILLFRYPTQLGLAGTSKPKSEVGN